MGKGDKRTRRGKLFMGSFGNSRPHHSKKTSGDSAPTPTAQTKTSEKAPAKKTTKKAAPAKKSKKK